MVLLHLKTDNENNISLAKFDTNYSQSYIQFSNINTNQTFLAGLSNNNLKFFNPTTNDEGLKYSDNLLTIKNINNKQLKNNDFTIFPNLETINTYEITGTSPQTAPVGQSRCFDLDDSSFWQSFESYNQDRTTNGNINTAVAIVDDNDSYSFKYSSIGRAYGNWIKIKFPFRIIPIGFSVSTSGAFRDPCGFQMFVSNDNNNWLLISSLSDTSTLNTNTFTFNNNTFYTYIVLVITRVIINPASTGNQYFQLKSLSIITKPILTLDSDIKICNNSIYNIDTINAKNLIINNSNISDNSTTNLQDALINGALAAFQSQYSIYWKTNNQVGYPDTAIVNKIAINQMTAFSTLDINGSISYNNRIINKKLDFTTISGTNFLPYQSSYISIGDIKYTSADNKGFFKLFINIYDTNRYYLQTINIFGYTFIGGSSVTMFKAYWKTSIDTINGIQKVTDVFYYLDTNFNKISFFIKLNDLIKTNNELFTSVIFIDAFHTTTNTIEFIIPSSITYFSEALSFNLYKATNITSNLLNLNASYFNSNVINKLSVNEITINNPSIKTSNLLFLDNNYKLQDSGINPTIINGLKQLNLSSNKIVATNSEGSLTAIDVNSNLLININSIANTSSNLLISSNGLFESFFINKNNLNDLNSIQIIPNSILIINSNNQIKTTTTVNIANISNILQLCDFNLTNQFVFFNSNINTNSLRVNSNLFVGNVTINSNNNRLFYNNREFGEDIYKTCVKFPPNLNPLFSVISSGASTIATFTVSYPSNNYYNLTLRISNEDNSSVIEKKVYNLFQKTTTNFWETQAVFKDYRSLTDNLSQAKFLDGDLDTRTKCGAYVIFELSQLFILTSYAFYVSYNDIKTTIRDFKIFAYNNSSSVWDLIDNRTGIILTNNFVANVFSINKNNYKTYSRFALCILNTNNNTNINFSCILNYIELYGYSPFFNDFNNLEKMTFNSENNQTVLGFNNIGISNINPIVPLSIGNDLIDNSTNSLINLNHPSYVTNANLEQPIMTLTRPSLKLNGGIKTIHYLNSWYESNSSYTIKLTHNYSSNENVAFSLNSDGKLGLGNYPDSNLTNNGISIFNNGLSFYRSSNFINIQTSNINNSYSVCLPPSNGLVDTTLIVNKIEDNTAYLNWFNPLDIIQKKPFIKFGNQSVADRTGNGLISLQVAGSCIMGLNTSINDLSDAYIQNNTLVVAGSIYATTDISTDSDRSYKYNLKVIDNSLSKISRINGYTFNRNDITGGTDETENGRYTGLIAQEVVRVIPEVITKKHDGKLRIIYANLAGLFVEGIKELDNNYKWLNFKINLCLVFTGVCLLLTLSKNA